MRIDKLHLIGFGKFNDFTLALSPGFNVVFGANEAGKSTVLNFIQLMLYGAKKDGMTRRYYLPEHEIYAPWSGSLYEGRLVFTLDNGRRIEVFRCFDKDAERISLVDADLGKEISNRYTRDRRDELLFAEEILGVNRGAFLGTALVGQLALGNGFDDYHTDLAAAMLRAAAGEGDSGGSAAAVEVLDKALERVGKTDRGKRAAELLSIIDRLAREREAALEARGELGERKRRLLELEEEAAECDRQARRLKKALSALKVATLAEQLRRVAYHREKVGSLGASLQSLREFEAFPHDLKDEVQRLEQRLGDGGEEFDRLRSKEKELGRELAQVDSRLKDLAPYRQHAPEVLGEVMQLRAKWEQLTESLRALKSQVKAAMSRSEERLRRLEELELLFEAIGPDADARVGELTREDESVNDDLVRLSREAGEASSAQGPSRALAYGFLAAAALLTLGTVLLAGIYLEATLALSGLALVGVGLHLIFSLRASHHARRQRDASDQYNELHGRRKALREERRQILSLAGVGDLGALLRLKAELESLRQSLADNEGLLQQKRIPQLEKEQEKVETRLLFLLRSVGLASGKAGLTDGEITAFIARLSNCQDLLEERGRVEATHGEHSARLKALDKQRDEMKKTLEGLYAKAEVRNYTEFLQKLEGKQEYLRLESELRRNGDLLDGLLAGRDEESLRRELDEARTAAGTEDRPRQREGEPEETTADLERGLEKVEAASSRTGSEMDQLRGRIEELSRALRDPGLMELEIEAAEAELAAIRKRREALNLAIEAIKGAAERLHAEFAPQLSGKVSELAARLTGGRYSEALLDEDLELRARAPEKGLLVGMDALSAGARDQLYLSARLAMADLLSKGESLPLLLDDSLVEYDEDRAGRAMAVLAEESRRRQVVYFTCHSREVEFARRVLGDTLLITGLES